MERLDDGTYWTDEVDRRPIADDAARRPTAASCRAGPSHGAVSRR